MKIRCLAIDDEPMALEKLKKYISKVPFMEMVATCVSASDALQVMSEKDVDAMFVDINMPDMSGLDFVRTLRKAPMVVFTTAYSEYAVDSYKVRAVDYLLKPFSFEDFQRAANNLLDEMKKCTDMTVTKERDVLFLKVDYRYVRVKIEDIVYAEGMNEYLKIYLADGDPILTHTTFKHFNASLPGNFLQVHRSYVVNMNHVVESERSILLMSNGARISISDSNKDNFLQYLQEHSIRKSN